jgi:hypothetical protein
MVNQFKFLQSNDYSTDMTQVEQQETHVDIFSHWDILPQDLRGATRLEMENYIEGWEAARNANYNNPYSDQLRGEVWNRGWHGWWARRNREIDAEQELVRMAFNTTNQPQHHGFYVGNTPLVLEYEGDAHIESVRAMTWDLQIRYANYVSINEQVIGFMQDYLNVHLSGRSIIRLA